MYFIIHVSYKWDSALHNPQKEIAFWGSGKSLHKSNLEYGCNCFWCWWFWLLCLKTWPVGKESRHDKSNKGQTSAEKPEMNKGSRGLGGRRGVKGAGERWGGSLGSLRNNTLSFSWEQNPVPSGWNLLLQRSSLKSPGGARTLVLVLWGLLPLLSWSEQQSFNTICRFDTGFPGGSVVKTMPANVGDTGSIPGWGRSPEGGNGNPLQCSCLENPMDRGAWRATVHGVAKSQMLNEWMSTAQHKSSAATKVKACRFPQHTGTGLSLWHYD